MNMTMEMKEVMRMVMEVETVTKTVMEMKEETKTRMVTTTFGMEIRARTWEELCKLP
ncbi:hypothetical protein Tco_0612082, partial [Tanacetum coccineum]